MPRDIIDYVPRERLDLMSDHVLKLSNALSLMLCCLVISVSCNVWQAFDAPSYSDAQRASLTALIDQLTSHKRLGY